MQGSSQSSSAIQLHPAASSKNSATSCRHCNAHRVLHSRTAAQSGTEETLTGWLSGYM